MIREIRTTYTKNMLWQEMPQKEFSQYDTNRKVLVVDSKQTYQTHMGFGGAFTESAAYAISKLNSEDRMNVIRAYFDKENGLSYNIGRVHINSCDFSLGNYDYIEKGDKELKTFDISREDKLVVPFIKDAEKVAGEKIYLLASPWSPPAFFKTTNEMNYGGKLKPEFREVWAEYYCKFILEMKKRDVSVELLTIQNEPAAVQNWDSCIYTAEEERDFVKILAKALKKYNLDTKILVWDHNRDIMVERANTVLCDPEANRAVWGTGIHWYNRGEHENLSVLKMLYPDKHILFTEGCVELTQNIHNDGNTYAGDIRNAELYARNIICDFNNYCEGFIDWNLFLNQKGGPNHVKNYCEAPIMVNENTKEVVYNPSYYYIGHFSKFIKVGAVRLLSSHSAGSEVYLTAYKNPNGEIVVVVLNQGWVKNIALVVDGKGVDLTLAERSIASFIIS